MKLQLLSDLHLESERFDPEPTPGADLLILAGDIDTTWRAYRRFRDWPVPVYAVTGNHEFEHQDLKRSVPAFRDWLGAHGITLLHRQATDWTAPDGTRLRLVGTPRWTDFDVFGPAGRAKALRACDYFIRLMKGRDDGELLDAMTLTRQARQCRRFLEDALRTDPAREAPDATVVITHFAPSLRSLDPRYGAQPGTAFFCNADDDLVDALSPSDLWIHGHVHCRHDWRGAGGGRVVCEARGFDKRRETVGYDPRQLIEIRRAG